MLRGLILKKVATSLNLLRSLFNNKYSENIWGVRLRAFQLVLTANRWKNTMFFRLGRGHGLLNLPCTRGECMDEDQEQSVMLGSDDDAGPHEKVGSSDDYASRRFSAVEPNVTWLVGVSSRQSVFQKHVSNII